MKDQDLKNQVQGGMDVNAVLRRETRDTSWDDGVNADKEWTMVHEIEGGEGGFQAVTCFTCALVSSVTASTSHVRTLPQGP